MYLWKISVQVHCPVFNQVVCVFVIELYEFFIYFRGFSGSSAGKESACNGGDHGLIPGLGRSPGEERGYPLQYSGLENSMDCIVHGVSKSQT